MSQRRILILGAAGKDFHVFNTVYRDDAEACVVAFTATQIPNIDDRRYPGSLAGPAYPDGIPIHKEADLERLVSEEEIDEAVFAYSDVSHEHVMHLASRTNAAGADFRLLSASATMLPAVIPVISVCAVRTGCGKSQTTRSIAGILRSAGRRVTVVRHPMPYGDLERMRVQRFASLEDLDLQDCSLEEREEYEHHIANGSVVYAGVDYQAILEEAQSDADILLWDGGNNDTPFYRSDLEIVLVDPHRPGDELTYHPGETNLRRADVILINKVDTCEEGAVATVLEHARAANPRAEILRAASPVRAEDPEAIRGKRVLVVEDGPTLTHGGMRYGAGTVAARNCGAAECVDPRPWAVGSIRDTLEAYPDTGPLLPAMGYGDRQKEELRETIEAVPCDVVLIGTPIDLAKVLDITKPTVRVTYSLEVVGSPTLEDVLRPFLEDGG